jgi:hypothetical protein
MPKPAKAKPARKAVPVFFVEATGEGVVWNTYSCGCGRRAKVRVGRFAEADRPEGHWGTVIPCPDCGGIARMSSQAWDTIWRHSGGAEINPDGGNLPAGACYAMAPDRMWRAGPDGRELVVVLPDGVHWHIDSRASNCKLPDHEAHYCWARTGRPEDGTLDVRKGDPRDAGGGSIRTGRYHGHLRNGQLVPCGDSQT